MKAIRGNWYVVATLATARQFWNDLPGPLWVKILLALILLACLAIPGQADEILVMALIKYTPVVVRKIRARRAYA